MMCYSFGRLHSADDPELTLESLAHTPSQTAFQMFQEKTLAASIVAYSLEDYEILCLEEAPNCSAVIQVRVALLVSELSLYPIYQIQIE